MLWGPRQSDFMVVRGEEVLAKVEKKGKLNIPSHLTVTGLHRAYRVCILN